MFLPQDQVAREVGKYIGKGIDFVKYASNEHGIPGAFLAFSPAVQAAIVAEAHSHGITARAHTMTAEGLRIAVEAGSDLIQHANGARCHPPAPAGPPGRPRSGRRGRSLYPAP